MNRTILSALFLFPVSVFTAQEARAGEIQLWPQGLPKESKVLPPERISKLRARNTPENIFYVGKPCLVPFPAPEKCNTGCAIVVCPGGGYNMLAWKKEGIEIAEWLNSLGVNAFVLKYRVPRRDPKRPYFEPLQDAQRAVRLVRHNASKWKVDAKRIGMLGFSAGGHLTIMTGLHFDLQTYDPVDSADTVSARPDFLVPIYPAYLGDDLRDDVAALGSLAKVTSSCPPTFMAVTWDDRMRGAQSALFFVELKKAGVTAELHVFSKGGHGYGLRPCPHPVAQMWPKLCAAWLHECGFLRTEQK